MKFKEVRLKPKIGQGDFDTKVRRAIEFLEEGDRIKVAVQFRGRELTHPQLGRNLLTKFADQVKDHGVVERAPLLEGKSMHITIASTHKPKPREAGVGERALHREGLRGRGRGCRPGGRDRRGGPSARKHGRVRPRAEDEEHKGSQKRIGVTGSGKPTRVNSWRGHHLEIKSSRRTRRYAGQVARSGRSTRPGPRLLPYLKKG